MLSQAERKTLQLVCETLLPKLQAEADDDARLFALHAGALGVADAMEQALGTLAQDQQRQFRLLLRALEQPLVVQALIGRAQPFSVLLQAAREQVLLAMARSRLPQFRTGFQGLKRLATFLFYSLPDAQGDNPTWPLIGYLPSANLPAAQPTLALTQPPTATTLECDVCIIGSGAGGSVVAAELATAGKRVIVLEAGGGQQAPDFDQRELVGMQRLYMDAGLLSTRDLGVTILAGATLGGGTTVNWQTCLRTPDAVRDEWAERSRVPHFADASFTRSLDAVTERLGVGTAETTVNPNNHVLQRGCEKLGYQWSLIPRNARGCDAAQCGYCVYGCRHGGKQSTAVTYLRDAQQSGDCTIVAHCRAARVLWVNGRVTGVEATLTHPETGHAHALTIRAPLVVMAAGAIQSPAILLRSGLRLPALGHNLFLHPTTAVAGRYAEPIEQWCGPPQSILCDEFATLQGSYGFRLETAPGHPGLIALATPWLGARDHRQKMQRSAHTASLIVLVRDGQGGRVRVGRNGRAVVEYRPGPQERAFLQRGIVEAARVHLAAGAEELHTLHGQAHSHRPPQEAEPFLARLATSAVDQNRMMLFSAHQMGTCCMGQSARSAVCNEDGEVFGVAGLFIADSSAFPAASGVNPMLTVMAMAHHTVQRIKVR